MLLGEKVTPNLRRILLRDFKITNHVRLLNFLFLIVPDDIIIDLVRDRLERPDCRTNGWILEGCPINPN